MKEVFRINNIKLIPGHSDDALFAAVKKEGLICDPRDLKIVRKSLDARDKSDIRKAIVMGWLSEREVRESAARIIDVVLRTNAYEGAVPYRRDERE